VESSVPSLAVVVFTDLVGSTALRSRVGEDVAEELRRRHDTALAEAVQAHGGRVVKGLGDGIMAVFPGASEALAASVAMQQAIARVSSRQPDAALRIRLGVSAGEVTWEDDDCFGTPVVEAARLCAAADGDQILAADVVKTLAGSRAGDVFSSVGSLSLKGLPQPVTAWEVRWEPVSLEVVLPRGLSSSVSWSFVGRRDELDVLDGAWAAAVGGERRAVFVGGEPGIGKTRLLAEFAGRVADRGGLVLYGRAEEELGVPFEPFTEALGDYVHGCAGEVLATQLGPSGGELTRLVPDLATLVADLPAPLHADPETERYQLLEAVRGLLERIAQDRPLLLILDDLHWATKPDVMLLSHVLRSSAGVAMLVLCAFRDTEVDAAHPLKPLLDDVPRLPGAQRVPLTGLDADDVVDLVADVTSTEADGWAQRLAHAVQTETSGNPFFVGEILRHLLEHDMVDRVERSADAIDLRAVGVPEGVRAVVERRIERLAGPAVEVLRVAAIIGARFDLPLLLGSAPDDLGEAAVLDALADAETAALVVLEPERLGWYRFAHAVMRDAVIAGMPSLRRLALHRRVGDALERRPDAEQRVAELAQHFAVAASLGDVDRAIDYCRRAGDRAVAALAFEEAAVHYQQALHLLDQQPGIDEPLRCDLLIALGETELGAGQAESQEVLLEAAHLAQRLGDADRLARAALANNPGFWSTLGRDPERVAALEAALELAGPARTATRARLLSRLAVEIYTSSERSERERLTDEALAIARELDDDATLAYVLVQQNTSTWSPTNLDRRLAVAEELRSLASRLDDPIIAYHAADFFSSYLGAGDIEAADRCLAEERRIVEVLGRPYFKWCLTAWHETMRALHGGRFVEAERFADEGLDIGAVVRDPAEALTYWGGAITMVRFDQGRLGELVPTMEGLPADQMTGIALRTWLALAYTETGRKKDARGLMRRNTAEEFDQIIDEGHMALSICALLAETAARVGDAAWADRVLPTLRACCGQIAAVVADCWGAVDRYVGLCLYTLGEERAAVEHFEAAIAVNHRARAPSWEARSRLDLATALVRCDGRTDRARAAELARAALESADALGMTGVSRQARELLATLG